ncbi:MAG: ATP-dependent DNA helicase RecG, partial [Muribaculaceae bacterium]|nr:ATP-dependent DNA helicase RecG [Muribaculaceae bacterium]
MNKLYDYDIKFLKGVGPTRAELLKTEAGISNLFDLINYFPNHYVDRSQIYKISSLQGEMPSLQLKGRFVAFSIQGDGAKRRLVGIFSDGTATIEVLWFNRIKAIQESLVPGNEYIIFGKPTSFNGRWSIVHPEVDPTQSVGASQGLRGIYPLTEKLRNRGFSSRTFHQLAQQALAIAGNLPDPLPQPLIDRLKLYPYGDALRAIHNPADTSVLERARFRLKFQELLLLQLNIQRYNRRRSASLRGFVFPRIGQYFNDFYHTQLPFPLTGAQKRVIKDIRSDMTT